MFHIRQILVAVVVSLVGVASASADEVKLKGHVTAGGRPLAVGKITFHMENGQFIGSKIKEGKYAIDRIPAGAYKVTLEGKGLLEKYATEETSSLTAMIRDGSNEFDFDLRSSDP